MSKIYADTIETENSNVDITLGAAGDAVLIPTGATLKSNAIQDAGGNNIITSDGSGNLTINSGLGGALTLLSTQTASTSSSIAFTTGIDSTYDVYCFRFTGVHVSTSTTFLRFQASTNGGSSYGINLTTVLTLARNNDTGNTYGYEIESGSWDQGNAANYQYLTGKMGTAGNSVGSGYLYLFTPSNTTYIKQFHSRSETANSSDSGREYDVFMGGYFNTTSAINAVEFDMSSGTIDDGSFKLYGISKS